MKALFCLTILAASAVWADEAADRSAIEATVAALNTPPASTIFTADFPNAAELQRLRAEAEPTLTLAISREPLGEATWTAAAPRFATRSVTFVAPGTAVVVAAYGPQSVLLVVKKDGADWRIASLRVLPEARTR